MTTIEKITALETAINTLNSTVFNSLLDAGCASDGEEFAALHALVRKLTEERDTLNASMVDDYTCRVWRGEIPFAQWIGEDA